jgi:predicted transposase YdaD
MSHRFPSTHRSQQFLNMPKIAPQKLSAFLEIFFIRRVEQKIAARKSIVGNGIEGMLSRLWEIVSLVGAFSYVTLVLMKGMSKGMTVTWDLYAKDLLKERPQDFATLVLAGARYIGLRESQYQMREIRLDTLIEVEYQDEPMLINFEFQSTKDGKMGKRLLIYGFEAEDEYELPILSCVLYLQKVNNASEPPLCKIVPGGRRVLWFDYISIELAEKTIDELREMNLLGVLPLFILSKDGQTHEVLDEVITRLAAANESALLAVTRLFAELAFTSDEDRVRLSRRFAMLQDIEETPTYKRLIAKGREQGLEEGLEQGLERGQLLAMRQNIEAIVQLRFPTLLKIVRYQMKQTTNLSQLQEILLKLSSAHTSKGFKQYLLNLMENVEETN